MTGHAFLSPSSAVRWLTCNGAPHLEAGFPDTSSEFADEGTAAHDLAARVLTDEDGKTAHDFIGLEIEVGKRVFRVDDDMASFVQIYVDTVRDYAQGHTLMVEQHVPIGHVTGEKDAGGTSDVIIVSADGDEIQVHDLKYGRGVQVYAEENPQLMLYAIGALHDYALVGDFKRVRMVIHQPRLAHLSEWDCSVQHITKFAQDAKAKAGRCHEAGKTVSGMPIARIGDALHRQGFLTPSDKGCQFCKAAGVCPALANHVADITGADFADETQKELPVLPTDVPSDADEVDVSALVAMRMQAIPLVETWCKAVRAETERRLVQGIPVPGFKLVEGRKGNRTWSSEAEAEELLKKFRLKKDQMYDFKLISPTTATKVLKGKPKQLEQIEAVITRADGKPSVAPASDKRPALTVDAVAEDFNDETGDSLV